MRETQRGFSCWFNKSRPYDRKGALWQDRFQCQLIQSDVYLFACLKYIEMNPVRARICNNAEDYQFSSFGRWKERHPYEEAFMNHILSMSRKAASMKDFKHFMKRQMQRMKRLDVAAEFRKQDNIAEAKRQLQIDQEERNESEIIIFTFAKKDWVSGKVIGSKDFIRQKYLEWKEYQDSA